MEFGILTDLSKCIGCEACANACKQVNNLKSDIAPALTFDTWTVVERIGKVNVRRQCFHCIDPTCVSVCPVGALEKTKTAPVIYHEERCIGCRYCMMACPFGIPRYEWESTSPRVGKCIMCSSRLEKGGQPGCTSVCPTGATIFGERDKLIETAMKRIQDNPGRYVDHIYGLKEVGGTSVLYLSDVPFEELGFPKTRTDTSYPKLTWAVLSQLPTIASVGGVLMCGIWWITHRRMEIAKSQAEAQADEGRELL